VPFVMVKKIRRRYFLYKNDLNGKSITVDCMPNHWQLEEMIVSRVVEWLREIKM